MWRSDPGAERWFRQHQKHLLYKTFISFTFQPSPIFSWYQCETFYSSSVCHLLPEHVSDEPDLHPLSKKETFANNSTAQHSGLIPLMETEVKWPKCTNHILPAGMTVSLLKHNGDLMDSNYYPGFSPKKSLCCRENSLNINHPELEVSGEHQFVVRKWSWRVKKKTEFD